MTQQYPPQYPQHPAPPPKKKRRMGCLLAAAGATVLVVIIVAASSGGGNDDSSKNGDAPAAAAPHKTQKAAPSPAEAFRSWVDKHGSVSERTAAHHVTKVQGADGKNDILDAADVYTDYTGDMMSSDAPSGKLIASAFADWQHSRGKDSKNGLVTVYNEGGELLSNGNY